MESSSRQTLVAYLASDLDIWKMFVRHYEELSTFVEELNKGLTFKQRVSVERYSPSTVTMDLIYSVLTRATKQLDRLPAFAEYGVYATECIAELATEISTRIPDVSKQQAMQRVAISECQSGLELFNQWTQNQAPVNRTAGKQLISEYFEERYVNIFRTRMDHAPKDTYELAKELVSQLSTIRSSCVTKFEDAFPEGDFPSRPEDAFQPVGIGFLDMLLCGGLVKGEVYGHAAPIGAGKTTLVSQVCWSRAEQVLDWFRVNKYGGAPIYEVEDEILARVDLPQIYFCVYEPVETLLANLVSNAAEIPRDTCREVAFNPALRVKFSSATNRAYKDYERKRLGTYISQLSQREAMGEQNLQYPAGELERFNRAVKIINRMVKLIDFSGKVEDNRANAIRGIDGLRDYIYEHQLLSNNPGVNFVAIDFVGAAVDIMAEAASKRGRSTKDDRANLIRIFPQQALTQIALRFQTPVCLAHQLNSTENKKKGGYMPDPQSTEGSQMFLMYCAAGFASGRLTPDNVAAFVPGKQRKAALSSIDIQLARLDNEFGRWIPADQFTVSGKDIVNKSDIHSGSRRGHGGGVRPAAGSR
jgi:hypothetical protein